MKCEACNDTGWYGDNGPGIPGNSEFHRCECGIDNKCTCGWHTYRTIAGVPWCDECGLEADTSISRMTPLTDSIVISPSKTADCDVSTLSKQQLLESSEQHRYDVLKAFIFFADLLIEQAEAHDVDKLLDIDSFYQDFKSGFKRTEWWDKHRKASRHHLNVEDGVPHNVNLIDVLDYIVDCVMAGMARSGKVYDVKIPPEVLMDAFDNTVDMLQSNVFVMGNRD